MSALTKSIDDNDLPQPRTTQAAEGMRRRPFTVAEIDAFVAAGIIDEHERFELIGGEVVPMAAKGLRHERLKTWLNRELARQLPESIAFTPETTFRLSEDTFLEPDFVLYETSVGLDGLNGPTCLLAIEVSDSSLSYDLGRKADIFSTFEVAELWVVDAVKLTARVHRMPTLTGYREVRDLATADMLSARQVPALRLRLADFE